MDVAMTSNSSKKGSNNNTVAASSQEHQEAMDTVPQVVEARKVKQTRQQAAIGEPKPRPQLDEVLRCPRCGSNNTKFCYYNNSKTSQPRYFCKACRRYWTQGGTLRSVPIGGRCHKKRSSTSLLPSSSSGTSSIDNQPQQKQKKMVPVSSTAEQQGFPNMLPTSSTGFELPGTQLPPLMPLSLPSLVPEPPLPLTFGSEMSFVDLLGGGFPGDHQGNNNNNGLDGATSSDMDKKWLIGYYGDDASPIGGGGAALQGDQWFTTTQVGADQKQEDGVSARDTASAK